MTSQAAEWTAFHGADGKNTACGTKLPTKWTGKNGVSNDAKHDETVPKLLWTAEFIDEENESDEAEPNSGYSSPVIFDEKVVITCNFGGCSTVFCLNEKNGELLWKYENGTQWTEMFPGTRSTPTINDGLVYDESPHGNIVCLDLLTGKKIWSRNVLEEYSPPPILYGKCNSLVINGDVLYTTLGGEKGAVLALDKKTGETRWISEPTGNNAGYGTPIIFEFNSEKILAAVDAKGIFAISLESHKLLFHFPLPARLDENISTPIFHNGMLFISNGAGSDSVMLELANDFTAEEKWHNKTLANAHGGVVLIDGRIYGTTNKRGGGWACVDWDTGTDIFFDKNIVRGSLTVADGLIYILTEFGEVILAKPEETGLEIRGKISLPEDEDGAVYAHPVVCGTKLYVRVGPKLYCFGLE
ncbi:MAG: PQQ-binding-like beta-propeller repeat protein [Thermoguttaceae bacterium]